MLLQPVSISLNLHRGISSVPSNFSPRETNYTLLISLHIRSPAQLRRSDGPRAQYKPQAREEREREREREAVEETRILAGIIYHAARDSESAVTDREEEIFRKAA